MALRRCARAAMTSLQRRGALSRTDAGSSPRNSTLAKRLATYGVDGEADARRQLREWLLLAPGLTDHVSGVILYDETFWQTCR